MDPVHTPWWILAGVKPMGPSVDMGTYKMSSFSKQQQAQYGVDGRGQITNWSRFTAATAALAPCAEPSEQQLGLDQNQAGVERPSKASIYLYKLVSNIPQFKLTHPPLFHQTFHQSMPSYHKIKILILQFQLFNEGLKVNKPQPKYFGLF